MRNTRASDLDEILPTRAPRSWLGGHAPMHHIDAQMTPGHEPAWVSIRTRTVLKPDAFAAERDRALNSDFAQSAAAIRSRRKG